MVAYTRSTEAHGKGLAYGLAGQIQETIVSQSKDGYSYVSAS
jgi:hypothetical protein